MTTIEEMHKAISLWELVDHFEDEDHEVMSLSKFRSRVWSYTRLGHIPKPARVPRTDGKKGTIGVYPDETLDLIKTIFSDRENRGRTRERLPKLAPLSGGQAGQELFSVGFWLPEELAARVDVLIEAGHPLSKQLLVGTRLMHMSTDAVRRAVIEPLTKSYGTPKRGWHLDAWSILDSRWACTCAFTLSTTVLERLDELSKAHGVLGDVLLSRWRFEFVVIDGEVMVKSVTPSLGKLQQKERG